jgi:hypothetical protein
MAFCQQRTTENLLIGLVLIGVQNTKIVSISKYFLFYVRWLRFLRRGVTFVEVI